MARRRRFPVGAEGRATMAVHLERGRVRTGLRIGAVARLLAVVVATIAALTVLPAARAFAAPYDVHDDGWEGTVELLRLLARRVGTSRVVAVDELSWERLRPDDGLFIVYPLHPLDHEDLMLFLKSGGRVAIIDDYGASEENLRRLSIRRVPAPSQPTKMIRQNPAMPVAEPVVRFATGRTGEGVHPVAASVGHVVMNHPTALIQPHLTPLLRIEAHGESDAIVALAGQVGLGKLIVVSDSSIVINQMLRYPGNRNFVLGIGEYLLARDEVTSPTGTLYVLTGGFAQHGVYADSASPRSWLRGIYKNVVALLQDLRSGPISSTQAKLLGTLALIAGMLWIVLTNLKARSPYRPRFAAPVAVALQGGVAGRAALLASPSTDASLPLLELKTLLEDVAVEAFSLRRPVSSEELLRSIDASGRVDATTVTKLKKLLHDIRGIEAYLVVKRPPRVRRKRLVDAARLVHDVIDRIYPEGRGEIDDALSRASDNSSLLSGDAYEPNNNGVRVDRATHGPSSTTPNASDGY